MAPPAAPAAPAAAEAGGALLSALESTDGPAALLQFMEQHPKARSGAELADTLQSLHARGRVRLAAALHGRVSADVHALAAALACEEEEEGAPSPAAPADGPEAKGGAEAAAAARAVACGAALAAAAGLMRLLVETSLAAELAWEGAPTGAPGTAPAPGPLALLHAAAAALHDHLLLGPGAPAAAQEATSRLCEAWWAADLPCRADFLPRGLPYLLVRALEAPAGPGGGAASLLKRLWALREGLTLFDYDDAESIAGLRRLMLRAAFAPAFLRAPDGRRFLALLFTLSAPLVHELGAILRNQLPAQRASGHRAYGDVLWRAWRGLAAAPDAVAAAPCLLATEGLIQGLMDAALLARSDALAAALRAVLGALHAHKAKKGVDGMLLRQWEPLLFRGLQAASPAVRRRAVTLLADAFPLHDPAAPAAETDARLQRQLTLLRAALADAAPAVRAAAADAAGRMLTAYWELLPAGVAGTLLSLLVERLALDASSAAVRAAAVAGLTRLVEQPLAHAALKLALPRLGALLGDAAARVRAAVAELLLQLRATRTLPFWEAAPLPALLAALGGGAPGVAPRLARLLLPSYAPADADGAEAARRLLAMVAPAPAAAVALCGQFLAAGGSRGAAAALAGALAAVLLDGVKEEEEEAPAAAAPVAAPQRRKGAVAGAKRRQRRAPLREGSEEPEAEEADDGEAEADGRLPASVWAGAAAALAELAERLVKPGGQSRVAEDPAAGEEDEGQTGDHAEGEEEEVGLAAAARLRDVLSASDAALLLALAPTAAARGAAGRIAAALAADGAAGTAGVLLAAPLLARAAAGAAAGGEAAGAAQASLGALCCVRGGAAHVAAALRAGLQAAAGADTAAPAAGARGGGKRPKARATAAQPGSAAGLDAPTAAACVSLLLQHAPARSALLAPPAAGGGGPPLASLLPSLRAHAARCVQPPEADADGATAASEAAAAAAMLAYGRAALHLALAARAPADSGDSGSPRAWAAAAAEGAAEMAREVTAWATAALAAGAGGRALGRVPAAALALLADAATLGLLTPGAPEAAAAAALGQAAAAAAALARDDGDQAEAEDDEDDGEEGAAGAALASRLAAALAVKGGDAWAAAAADRLPLGEMATNRAGPLTAAAH